MRLVLRDFMAAVAVGAAVTTWSVRNAPARFPLIAALVISLALVFKTVFQRPRAGFHRWAFNVIAAISLLAGAGVGGAWGLALKEEVRARQGLVDLQTGFLKSLDGRIDSLRLRIAKSEGRETRDPRHVRWVKELAEARSDAGLIRRRLATYRRLAARPWEPFPNGRDDRVYLDPRERDYLNHFVDSWGTVLWSGGGAAAVAAVGLVVVLLPWAAASRLLGWIEGHGSATTPS